MSKTFQDMVEDSVMMLFKEIWDWDTEVKIDGKIKIYKFQAVLHMPGHHDSFIPREYWPQQQPKTEKDLVGYRNFPWGKYQVFCGDDWIGETEQKDQIQVISREYLIAKLKKERETCDKR